MCQSDSDLTIRLTLNVRPASLRLRDGVQFLKDEDR
jgi:hypothetical protein